MNIKLVFADVTVLSIKEVTQTKKDGRIITLENGETIELTKAETDFIMHGWKE